MQRMRDPARDKAKEIWEASSGKLKVRDIAEQLGVPETTARAWKSKDGWGKNEQSCLEQKGEIQPSNTNSKARSSENIDAALALGTIQTQKGMVSGPEDNKGSFTLYTDCLAFIGPMDMESRGRLFTAILDYASIGKVQPLQTAEQVAFMFIKHQIDREACKHAETCRRRSEAGKMGGRPKKQ